VCRAATLDRGASLLAGSRRESAEVRGIAGSRPGESWAVLESFPRRESPAPGGDKSSRASHRNRQGSCSFPRVSGGGVGRWGNRMAWVLPEVSWAVFCGHLDLVERGIAVLGHSAAAAPADLPLRVEPLARLAVLVEYPLDLLVGSLGPTGRCPRNQCLGIRQRSSHDARSLGWRLRRGRGVVIHFDVWMWCLASATCSGRHYHSAGRFVFVETDAMHDTARWRP